MHIEQIFRIIMRFLQIYTSFFIHFSLFQNPILRKTSFFFTAYKAYLSII